MVDPAKCIRVNLRDCCILYGLKGLHILAQGIALGNGERDPTSPERAGYSEVANGTYIYHALSGLKSIGIVPQGVALGWYMSPLQGFSTSSDYTLP